MHRKFILIMLGLIALFSMGNYYIGIRFWQSIGHEMGQGWVSYYWLIFFLLTGTYFWGRIGAIYFPGDCSDKMIWAGSYWLGMAFYLCLCWLLYDIGFLLAELIRLVPYGVERYSVTSGLGVLVVAIGVVGYGMYNARKIKILSYEISINKRGDKGEDFHIVMVSDLHLGLLVGRARLRCATQIINKLHPDVVLLPGDIIDENIGAFVENGMPEILCSIRSRFGVFGVLGSHEYIYGHAEKTLEYLKQSGVKILRDTYVQLPDGVYLVGRDDVFREQLLGSPRKPLCRILQGCKGEYPIILMDHQPVALEEAQLEGVDLQLSGHTHRGQLFPLGVVTRWLFDLDWGYLQRGMYQLIVSSGYGTWGPPLRLGTTAEIVDIRIKFLPHSLGEKNSDYRKDGLTK